MNGHQVFNGIFQELNDLKKAGSKLAKRLMNTMYGTMCQKAIIKARPTADKPYIINDDITLLTITPFGNPLDGISTIEYLKDQYFKFDYARMGVFLTSYCRMKIAKILKQPGIYEHVVRCHTDGFICNDVPEVRNYMDKLVGDKLGQWKSVSGKCYVKHANFVLKNEEMDEYYCDEF